MGYKGMEHSLALALALEGPASASPNDVSSLGNLAHALSLVPDPEIDARFAASLEAHLLSVELEPAAPRIVRRPEQAAQATIIQLPRRRHVVRKGLVAAIAAAMLFALPVVASATALPGDPLFGIERLRQNFAISHAHGWQKILLLEDNARDYFDYARQQTIVRPGMVASDLSFAARQQGRAASGALRIGTPAQIAWLQRMILADVSELRALARDTSGTTAQPALVAAIASAHEQAARLGDALGTAVAVMNPAPSTIEARSPAELASAPDLASPPRVTAPDASSASAKAPGAPVGRGSGTDVDNTDGCTLDEAGVSGACGSGMTDGMSSSPLAPEADPAKASPPSHGCPAAATCGLFASKPARWPVTNGVATIKFWINPAQLVMPETDAIAAVLAATKTWSAADPSVRFEYQGPTTRTPSLNDRHTDIGFARDMEPSVIARASVRSRERSSLRM